VVQTSTEAPNETPEAGLTSEEARARLARFGANEITKAAPRSTWAAVFDQFRSPLVLLLLAACVVSAALGELADALSIGAIVLLNGLVGFVQEHRAERALQALRSMTAPHARVVRDGRLVDVPAASVVPGDALALEAGDVVAADGRVVSAHALTIVEAPLTGESAPVEKRRAPSAPGAPLAERHDCVFAGTAVAAGTGLAIVTATGMRTELGRIAELLATVDDDTTPLQRRLARLSTLLLNACLGLVALVTAIGLMRGLPAVELLLSAVSLAVAAVPEGLPAIVTVALALGVQRMAARHALVRRLIAVETLGSATIICTDKTGTLTTGVMAVRELWGADHRRIVDAAAACSDAELGPDRMSGVGDPTEVALLVAAAQRGIQRGDVEASRPRRSVNPFDAERRCMSILRSDGVLYVKGAVEALLQRSRAAPPGIREANDDMASRGLRVLAIAVGDSAEERDLDVIGLVGIADPPRTEAVRAIARARAAGIRTVMITGDHPVTARAIARELGIVAPDEPDGDFVHARATPEHKLDIVRDLKARGHVVAMTGDGVNDAPALREAHVGIAMGRTGTEVTREASDIVLTDDDISSVVTAVEQGRAIFDNIRKTVVYLLAGNVAELGVMLGAALLGLPLPLLPLHLLWINLVTDGLPALALVVDPPRADSMRQPPRPVDEPILRRREWHDVLGTGALQAGITLAVFVWALESRSLEEARNLAFSVLVFGELLRAFACRDPDLPFWRVGLFTNLHLLGIVAVSALVQIGIHHIPATQAFFEIGALRLSDCVLSVLVGLFTLGVLEALKASRRGARAAPPASST